MDCVKAIQSYITRVISQPTGIKILLLDQDTTGIVSLATTQSNLLQHQVYLTDRIDNPSRGGGSGSEVVDRLPHLKCCCLVRPTEESIQQLERELQQGRYGSYYLYFTNVLTKLQIERLAEADQHELVHEVQEYFCDYSPLTPSHFTLNIMPTPLHPSPTNSQRTYALYGSNPNSFSTSSPAYERHLQGLLAVLLSLKKKPIVRYERMSSLARQLSIDVVHQMNNNDQSGLWDFRRTATNPILIVLDRRNDPVTPLLTQWTYQAMVHEELGILNGRVSLENAPDVREELKELVLSPDQDPFFSRTIYDNFGDLGAHLSEYVSEYSEKSAKSMKGKIETVQDMKKFIDEYPEFRKLGSNVSKHVALVGELSRLVNEKRLLETSELEQSLASNESHSSDLRAVQTALTTPEIPHAAKLRLAILYALRYQKLPQNQIGQIVEVLRREGVEDAEMVNIVLQFAGADQRQDDLFANENFFSRGKSALKGLKGVENVYTQHTPHLAETIDLLLRGRLKESSYPFVDGQGISPQGGGGANGGAAGGNSTTMSRPQDVILFIIGGTTYEEARHVAQLNAQFAAGQGLSGSIGPNSAVGGNGNGGSGQIGVGTRILLGGTCVHNSKSFLTMIRDASFSFPASSHLPLQSSTANSSLSSRPPPPPSSSSSQIPPPVTNPQPQQPFALSLGPVSLNVDHRVGNTLEAGVDAARDGLKDLFGKVKSRVDGVRLN